MNLHQWRWIPNALTFLRILLIVPFAMALRAGDYRTALLIFILASATDGVDGFLARRFDWGSRVGAIADPLADKALLITAYLMLALAGVLPIWLFLLVVGRDLMIVCGGLAFHYIIGRFDMAPSLMGKLNTVLQVAAVLLVMALQAGLALPVWTAAACIWVVAFSTLFSGLHYLLIWSLRAGRTRRL